MDESETARRIGNLQAKVDMLVDNIGTHAKESREGRRQIYTTLDKINTELSHAARSIEEFKKWRDDVDPKLVQYERWRERGIGAWMAIVAFSSTVIGALAYFGNYILSKLGF